jgi:hypothetical protein
VLFNRRKFIRFNVIAWTASLLSPLLNIAKANSKDSSIELNVLQAYIEILLPEDDLLPGALQLGADTIIIKKAEQDEQYAKAIRKGISWLNFLAKKLDKPDFSQLPKKTQYKIVTLSEQSNIATLPNLFYHTIRQDVFQYYYSHPQVLKQFKYARPPQPLGFKDFTKPPVN